MYGSSHPDSAPMNGIGGDLVDGSGTINPAALDSSRMSTLCSFLPFPNLALAFLVSYFAPYLPTFSSFISASVATTRCSIWAYRDWLTMRLLAGAFYLNFLLSSRSFPKHTPN